MDKLSRIDDGTHPVIEEAVYMLSKAVLKEEEQIGEEVHITKCDAYTTVDPYHNQFVFTVRMYISMNASKYPPYRYIEFQAYVT